MSELSEAFLSKAQESLEGAASEFSNGRYNNCANRCYYACFQAAVAALDMAGIHPTEGKAQWSYEFVQSQFAGRLINRRKVYPSALRDTLTETYSVREQADYSRTKVSQRQASRVLKWTGAMVTAIINQGDIR
ncbi:MAG: HEPN domain-containing protein [Thermomicrobiales bacterium]